MKKIKTQKWSVIKLILIALCLCATFTDAKSQEPQTKAQESDIVIYTRIKAWDAKIARSPKNDAFYVQRGEDYLKLRKYDLAREDAEKALQLYPKNRAAQKLKEDADSNEFLDPFSSFGAYDYSWNNVESSQNPPKKSVDKPQPPKTEDEWKAICRPFWSKMYEALKKKDVETAKNIYTEFDAATQDHNGSIRVKVERNSLLHDMYFSVLPQLKDFVENEMKRLKYTEKEKNDVKKDTSKGFYV